MVAEIWLVKYHTLFGEKWVENLRKIANVCRGVPFTKSEWNTPIMPQCVVQRLSER